MGSTIFKVKSIKMPIVQEVSEKMRNKSLSSYIRTKFFNQVKLK